MKTLLISLSVLGFLAVALGAFGAHGLEPHMSDEQQEWFATANRYHFYHVLAALLLFVWYIHEPHRSMVFGISFFIIGILLFSGSLYLMAMHSFLGLSALTWLGPVTPLGGLFFLAGWAMLLWSAVDTL